MPTAAIHASQGVDLSDPSGVYVYKLIAFQRERPQWRSDRLLPIAPVSESLGEMSEPIVFRRGEKEELEIEAAKRATAAASAARARRRGSSGQAVPKTRRIMRYSVRNAQHASVKATQERCRRSRPSRASCVGRCCCR